MEPYGRRGGRGGVTIRKDTDNSTTKYNFE